VRQTFTDSPRNTLLQQNVIAALLHFSNLDLQSSLVQRYPLGEIYGESMMKEKREGGTLTDKRTQVLNPK